MSVYDKILRECHARNVSIYALEKAIGASKGSIIKWEKSKPSIDAIVKIADYFNVSVDYLMGRAEFTDEDKANGVTDSVKLKLNTEEYELILNYRELKEADIKKGTNACTLVRDYVSTINKLSKKK